MNEQELERVLGVLFLLIITAGAIGMSVMVTEDCMEEEEVQP